MKVIQFPHPGNEHHYSKKELADGIKNYNSKKSHERNFIHANGTYIATNGVPQKESLIFWGEWEMYARVNVQKEKILCCIKGLPLIILQ